MPELDDKQKAILRSVEEHTEQMMRLHRDNQKAKRNRKTLEDFEEMKNDVVEKQNQ